MVPRHVVGLAALAALLLYAPSETRADPPSPRVEVEVKGNVLRIRNRTPFLVSVYVGGIRAGWIRSFRTELFSGLKPGRHKLFVASHYGSVSWGPSKILVPGTWNLTPPAGNKASEKVESVLSSRVYRRNRKSLSACDKLADRRGEELSNRRADFEILVSAEGKPKVKVEGARLSRRHQACYAAMCRTWSYPSTGSPYTINFQHIP